MKMTSKMLARKLEELEQKRKDLIEFEANHAKFNKAHNEKIEDVRPGTYNFIETSSQLNDVMMEIAKYKHALNVFNSTTTIGNGFTIDTVLILLPLLKERKQQLQDYRTFPEKKRVQDRFGSYAIIDYTHRNYKKEDAQQEYDRLTDTINSLQDELDLVNSTKEFEVE